MKGVILAGGTGSRLHPLTRITNKHLLPLYDRPMISYGIEALVGSGVTEIMLVTGVYFYDDSVWRVLPELKPSGRGELEITDVNNWYLDHAQLEYDVLGGFWGDAGESIQAYYAVGDFVRANGANKES